MTEMKHKAERTVLKEVGTAETDAAIPAGTRTSAAEREHRKEGRSCPHKFSKGIF